jgi:hypothetical protein
MILDYSEHNVVKVNMIDYVKKILNEAPEEMDGTATSPAALTNYSGSLKESNYWTTRKASPFMPPLPSYYSYASAEGQTFKPPLPFCARESNNQLSMTSTSFPK